MDAMKPHRAGWRRGAQLGLLALLSLCAQPAPALRAATLDEYQVKAVFLFNFTQFVEWPASAFASPDSQFVIGVLGDDPFGANLDAVVQGEQVGGHPIAVRRYSDIADASGAHILFISQSAAPQIEADAANRLAGKPMLTVSDAGTQTSKDVVVRFLTANNRIRLRINVASAQAARLVISSKLLRPAEIVGGENGR